LGLTRQANPEKIEVELMAMAPRELWTLLSHWLIWHGRRRCGARRPDCCDCELASLCPSNRTSSAGRRSAFLEPRGDRRRQTKPSRRGRDRK
jgi:endonuclease III